MHEHTCADRLALFPDCCLETPLRKGRDGFGRINLQYNGRRYSAPAHRVAYSLFVAPVRVGESIRHRCGNPACCNPRHLVKGRGDEARPAATSFPLSRESRGPGVSPGLPQGKGGRHG